MSNDVSLIATLIFLWGRPVRGVFFSCAAFFLCNLLFTSLPNLSYFSTVNVVLIFMQGRMPSLQAGARSELFRGS